MKRILSGIIALSVFFSSSYALVFAQEQSFTDIPAHHRNALAIKHLAESGVINGYDDGSFKPDKVVNRAEALKIILKNANIEELIGITETGFSDVKADQWYAPFVVQARDLGVVNGNPDGTFTPGKQVKRAAFLKMLLETNRFRKDKWNTQQFYADVPMEAWYAPYMNYAGKSGLLIADANENLYPDKELTRGEVSEIIYIMNLILNGNRNDFLVKQAELHMAQIEIFIGAKDITAAKKSSELSVDLTQQALSNLPENNVVLAAAKIARAYDLLVNAYIAGLQKRTEDARSLAEQTKIKATEGWEADNSTQPIAKHIKDRADEILSQL